MVLLLVLSTSLGPFLLLILAGAVVTLFKRTHEVQLRDAVTGELLGLTKKQHKKLMLALGTRNSALIARAFRELQERKRKLNQGRNGT